MAHQKIAHTHTPALVRGRDKQRIKMNSLPYGWSNYDPWTTGGTHE